MAVIRIHLRARYIMSTLAKTRDWESVFSTWAQGPSKTEQEKAENAERQIYQAILSDDYLKRREIRVFTQGSYRNHVNVRKESDVDIGVLCFDSYFSQYKDDNIKAAVMKRWEPATYTYTQFKNELQQALETKFGVSSVIRGDKAFKIKENTYRVNADVTAFFEHRRYYSTTHYHSGVQMLTDKGKSIINWPEQHYQNGSRKNTDTGRKYKRVVRILKTLCNEMEDAGIKGAKSIPSFLIECLVWNSSNSAFNYVGYWTMLWHVLEELYNATLIDQRCSEWGEVSELKYLFRNVQPWTREQANNFLRAAFNYVGYQ